jgi:LysM repeat protein
MADETSESKQAQQSSRGEWLRFGILVVILIGVVGVVALSRPLIFGRIVPAVMVGGEKAAAEPEAYPAPAEAPAEAAPSEASPAAAGDNEVFIPAAASGSTEAAPVGGDEEEGATVETAVPPADPTPVIYTVQAGDTLLKISRQFNVDVNTLMAANNIGNADFIYVGQELVIPAK